jgi:DNA-binding PadR family transcriptional regulator
MKDDKVFADVCISKDMRHAVLKIIILRIIRHSRTHAYAIMQKIKKIPHLKRLYSEQSMKNDIYNTIKILEQYGYITPKAASSNGRAKKVYSLTAKGLSALKKAKTIYLRALREAAQAIG